MATKPTDSYKWGENADKEQLGGYVDEGWPDDSIPPKRTHFNWYQNLVGKWLGWVEDTVDELVGTVLDAWFVEVAGLQNVPNKTGIYKHELDHRFYLVHGDHMATVGFAQTYFTASFYTWDGSQWVEGGLGTFTRSNTRTDILQESETNYVTPKGLVDYFSVKDTTYPEPIDVPHKSGMHIIKSAVSLGFAFVADDSMVVVWTAGVDNILMGIYEWENGAWVQQ